MKFKYVLPAFCLLGTLSLDANEDKLGDLLQSSGEKEVLLKPQNNKKLSKKQSRFVFKDEYHSNGIGQIDKTASKDKSESYEYENKSRFKFKFNDGYQESNLVSRYGAGSMGSAMGSSGFGSGNAGGGNGRRYLMANSHADDPILF